MMNNNDEIELSPGFFDLNNEDNEDNEDIIPDKINVENNNNDNNDDNNENNNDENNQNNIIIDFFTLLIFTAKPCDCQGSWTRTSTY